MEINSPENTIAVILGAHQWPNANFSTSQSFLKSAESMQAYLLSKTGFRLPNDNLLNLFDSEKEATEQILQIGEFIKDRKGKFKELLKNILLYYVGHGAFHETSEYFLAIRKTRKDYEYLTSLQMRGLADCLKNEARYIRRFIVLDCCFAGAANSIFQSGAVQAALIKTAEVLPTRGTVILCSSSQSNPSKAPKEKPYTMFSGVLIEILANGYPINSSHFSMADICKLTREKIREEYENEAILPELHSPDQREGNLADFPLFPNPIITKPASELRPSLSINLSVEPKTVEVGGNVNWKVMLLNDGDDDLQNLFVTRNRTLLEESFDLAIGKERLFAFTTTYKTQGKKTEKVSAISIAKNGEKIRNETSATVQVRQPREKSRVASEPHRLDTKISKPVITNNSIVRDKTMATLKEGQLRTKDREVPEKRRLDTKVSTPVIPSNRDIIRDRANEIRIRAARLTKKMLPTKTI